MNKQAAAFQQLSRQQQTDAVLGGTWLLTRKQNGDDIYLYNVQLFFVEVHIRKMTSRSPRLKPFQILN